MQYVRQNWPSYELRYLHTLALFSINLNLVPGHWLIFSSGRSGGFYYLGHYNKWRFDWIDWLINQSISQSINQSLSIPSGASGNELSPSGMIAGSLSRVTPVHTHLFQIFFQCILPCPLWSSKSPSVVLWLIALVAGSRRMWPTNRLLWVVTMSCGATCLSNCWDF